MTQVASSGSWFWQAAFAMVLFAVPVPAINWLKKNYGMHSDVFSLWYFIGTILSFVFVFWPIGYLTSTDFKPDAYKAGAFLFGLTLNSAANLLLFRAYAAAPNLAGSVVNSKNVLVFVTASVLGAYLPAYFNVIPFHYMYAIGVVSAFMGVMLHGRASLYIEARDKDKVGHPEPSLEGSLWFWQALGAAFCFLPSVLAVGFFKKNFGMDTTVFLLWYFLGTVVSVAVVNRLQGKLTFRDVRPDRYKFVAAMFGTVFNATANALLFKAYAVAPNLAESVVDSQSAFLFLVMSALMWLWPQHFGTFKFHPLHALGVTLVAAGVVILALKWG